MALSCRHWLWGGYHISSRNKKGHWLRSHKRVHIWDIISWNHIFIWIVGFKSRHMLNDNAWNNRKKLLPYIMATFCKFSTCLKNSSVVNNTQTTPTSLFVPHLSRHTWLISANKIVIPLSWFDYLMCNCVHNSWIYKDWFWFYNVWFDHMMACNFGFIS